MKLGPTPQNAWDVTPAEASLIRPVKLPRPAASGDLIKGLTESDEVRQAQAS
ncbi:MAG TPA: hypothetical protein VFL53_12700 [Pseudolabrys sp.]|nr:hypothetical protein [Pseudolabrys sp.]